MPVTNKIALSVVSLAGAAAKASGSSAIATACELALKADEAGRAISDIPVEPVRAAIDRVNPTLAKDTVTNRLISSLAAQAFIRNAEEANVPFAVLRRWAERAGGIGIADQDLEKWLDTLIEDYVATRARSISGTDEAADFDAAQPKAQPRFDAARHGCTKRSPPIAPPWRNGRASAAGELGRFAEKRHSFAPQSGVRA